MYYPGLPIDLKNTVNKPFIESAESFTQSTILEQVSRGAKEWIVMKPGQPANK